MTSKVTIGNSIMLNQTYAPTITQIRKNTAETMLVEKVATVIRTTGGVGGTKSQDRAPYYHPLFCL